MLFRKAHLNDAATLFELHKASVGKLCAEAYPQTTLDAWFQDRDTAFYNEPISKGNVYVAEADGKIIGFLELNPGEITNIFVSPTIAGKGIGSFLLKEGLKIIQPNEQHEVFIEATLNAIPFYSKHGFKETGRGEWVSPTGTIKIPVIYMTLRLHP